MKTIIIILLVLAEIVDIAMYVSNRIASRRPLPANLQNDFTAALYERHNAYRLRRLWLDLLQQTAIFILITAVLAFNLHIRFSDFLSQSVSDYRVRDFLFIAVAFFVWYAIKTTFDAIRTYSIDEKYGTNKTTKKRFVSKASFLLIIGVAFSFLLSFFENDADVGNDPTELLLLIPVLILTAIIALLIAPYLYKFLLKLPPLEQGALNDEILGFARANSIPLKTVLVEKTSDSSTKMNGLLLGYGKNITVVLNDNLINGCTTDEIKAVIAHEYGHHKKKHVLFKVALIVVLLFIFIFAVQYVFPAPFMYTAFGFAEPSRIYLLFCLAVLYRPVSLLVKIPFNYLSRKWEYAADKYAISIVNKDHHVSLLKKIAKQNLSNLSPHPFMVALEYSHPPLTYRLAAIEKSSPQ
jgi:STE24 endopeptidase